MRKRIMSILLTLCMALSLLPVQVLAAGAAYTTGADTAVHALTAGQPTGTALTQENISKYKHEIDSTHSDNGVYLPAGNYYLAEDIYLVGDDTDPNSAWPLIISEGAVTLDLNGHVLDLRGKNITIFASLTLTDSSQNAEHKFRVEDSGLWVWDETRGTETVAGGVITGGTGVDSTGVIGIIGGGVNVTNGSFTMTGGSIVGCTANNGGGVSVTNGSFTMNSGSIAGCTAVKSGNAYGNGGGVYVGDSATFNMNDGSIVGCTADSGGGVFVDDPATFTMNDGSIENCTADIGGGVYVGNLATFNMNDGSIVGCTANIGGGVYMGGLVTFNMTGGNIESCTADNGGGVYMGGGAQFEMKSGGEGKNPTIKNCIAVRAGGGVYMDGLATFNMTGGNIESCTADNGGGVYMGDGAQFEMNSGSEGKDPTIKNCIAVRAGGGVFVDGSATFNMNDGSIEDCKASGAANAVHADGNFTDNRTSKIDKSLVSGINAGHTGAVDDPILIGSAAGLEDFRDKVNGGATTLCATLVCDIVLNDGTFDADGTYTGANGSTSAELWTPIGDSSNLYAGTFDGGGHTIKGLYVNGEQIAGLFGEIGGATIRDVTVDGYVKGKSVAGGIVGYGNNRTTVTGCTNAATVKGGYSHVGGIVGRLYYEGNVRNCANLGSVRAQIDSERENAFVGGIAGYVHFSATIADCYNAGSIAIQDSGTGKYTGAYLGGIIGRTMVLDLCYISNCYSVGSLTYRGSASAEIYGIAGNTTGCVISHCYWLEGTVESGVGGNPHQTTDLTAHTKAEFADGTVLALLKGDRTDSPWTKTGYLAAAGMTLPLLSRQTADAHTHNKNGNLGGCDCGQLPAGTADDPYLIYTAEDLKLFRDMVNGGNTGICAKLMNDIVLNDGTFDENGNYTKGTSGKDADMWMPINGYGGTFDGDGHTIQGVYVNYGGDAGLFSSASGATIKGLTITGYIKGKDRVGGIVGYMSSGTITGCRNAAVVRGEQSSYIACGGIAGRLTTGTIANCENVGSVQATLSGDGLEVGGIVGHAGSYSTSAIFEACANLGSVTAIVDDAGGYARVGGITGFVAQHVDLIDCYNAGSLLLTEQKGTPADSCLGGIFGCKFDGVYSSESELPSASNCYNVGTMTHTGNGKVAIGDIGGETPNIKIINCYGLTAQTKAAFADGTALALLKGDRTDSPWTKTGYLAAAGMTLPLLSWQTADAHTHDYQWKYDNTEHWKECSCGFIEQGSKAAHEEVTGICTDGIKCECGYEMHTATGWHDYPEYWTAVRPGSTHIKACRNPGCGVMQSNSCTGGTATCKEQATCEVCGESYGTTDPNNHADTTEWIQTDTKHTQKYKCCGAIVVAEENHEWENGVCTECHYTCTHTGGTATCKDKAKCEVCGESYGALDPKNHSDLKHFPAVAATKTAEGNIEYWYCTGCGKYYKDAKAAQEITKADTVTAKLPSHTGGGTGTGTGNKPGNDTVASSNTGDSSTIGLWSVTLCGSLAACLTLAAAQRRRKKEQ